MTFLEAYEKFRSIETRHDLFNLRIQGVFMWDYMRFPIWQEILRSCGLAGVAHLQKSNSRYAKFTKSKNISKYTILRNPMLIGKCDYLFLAPGASRRKKEGVGKLVDIYCDPIIDHLGADNCLLIEPPMSDGAHHKRNKTKRWASTAIVDLALIAASRTGRNKLELKNEEERTLEELEFSIRNEFNLATIELKPLFLNQLAARKIALPIIKRWLNKLQPRAVFIVCSYYGREIYIEACRELAIPIIELQHGTISPYHLGYSYPEGTQKVLAPDYFFSFGRYWEESVNLPMKSEHVRTLGYPYMDATLPRAVGAKKKQIVFISQGTIGLKLSHFAVRLKQFIPSDWKIIVKLHPGEIPDWASHYPELAASEIEVIAKNGRCLYELLAESSVQIGVYSTAIYEGLALECKTYLVNLDLVEYMQPLLDRCYCTLVDEPEEIDLTEGLQKPPWDKNYFFADDWRKRFDAAIAEWIT